jgi:hypothetical protein
VSGSRSNRNTAAESGAPREDYQAYGHMVLKSVDDAAEGGARKIHARSTLNDPNNRVIAEETQSFAFSGDSQTRVIDCEFVLYATAGRLDIGDTKEGTFPIRLAPELSASPGRMTNSNGPKTRKLFGASRLTRSIMREPFHRIGFSPM